MDISSRVEEIKEQISILESECEARRTIISDVGRALDAAGIPDDMVMRLAELAKRRDQARSERDGVAQSAHAKIRQLEADVLKLIGERDVALANAETLKGCVERLQVQDPTVSVTKLEPSFEEHRAAQENLRELGKKYWDVVAENSRLKGEIKAAKHTASAAVDRYRQFKDQGAGPASRRELKRLRRRLAAYAPLLAVSRKMVAVLTDKQEVSEAGMEDLWLELLNAFTQATSTNLPPVASDDWVDRLSDAVDRAIKAAKPLLTPPPAQREIRVVFDGPPGPESGRFVEVEDETGRSINAGQWHDRGDGLWDLRIPQHPSGQELVNAWEETAKAQMGLSLTQQTIAEMHAAAMGKVCDPVRGMVEDVADVRAKLVSLQERRADQSTPTYDPTKPDVWETVIAYATRCGYTPQLVALMRERRELGIQRYGTPLQAWNGRDVKRDLREELLDATAYAAQAAIERRSGEPVQNVLEVDRWFRDILNLTSSVVHGS